MRSPTGANDVMVDYFLNQLPVVNYYTNNPRVWNSFDRAGTLIYATTEDQSVGGSVGYYVALDVYEF